MYCEFFFGAAAPGKKKKEKKGYRIVNVIKLRKSAYGNMR